MADILLNGDINIAINGDIELIINEDEIIQTAVNNLRLRFGELEFHSNIGNKIYNTRLKLSDQSIPEITNYCIEALLIDNRISEVTQIEVSITNNICEINFELLIFDGMVAKNTKTIEIRL